MNNIEWIEEIRLIDDLKPFEKNPRKVTDKKYQQLIKNIKACGYNNRILCNLDNTIIGGHARLQALKQLGITEVKVLVPSRMLTDEEFKRVNITDNLDFGEWDFDILANEFEIPDLIEWGFDDIEPFEQKENKEEKSLEEKDDGFFECEMCNKMIRVKE